MNPTNTTQAPTPGPLSGFQKGDVVRQLDWNAITTVDDVSDQGAHVGVTLDGKYGVWPASRFAFIGRPSADGWMPWSGGENPVPGQRVELLLKSGITSGVYASDEIDWADPRFRAFRLAPTAPVEAPSTYEEVLREGQKERGLSVPELPSTAPVEASGSEIDERTGHPTHYSHRPQPSGETREADLESGEMRTRVVNIVERYTTGWGGEYADNPYDAAPLLAGEILALLSARPLALGGQQGGNYVLVPFEPTPEMMEAGHAAYEKALLGDRRDVTKAFKCRWSAMLAATPARAEAQDEGAAGEREALALDNLANAAEVVRRLLHKTKEVQGPSFREAGISFSTAIDHARAVLRQRDALLAHPSPAPAADAGRVRECAELFKALREQSWDLRCFDVPTGGDDCDIGWRVVGHWQAEPKERVIAEVFVDDPAAAVRQALADLKSEGK